MPVLLTRRNLLFSIVLLALAGCVGWIVTDRAPVETGNLPDRLSDTEYWRIVTDFSESDGFFRSDNFISNETTFQQVIPELLRTARHDGVYLGVGPDQNFTYITALNPKLAFIIDIRRQNMLQHLMYKAIVELSANRAEFLSMLFSRVLPENLAADATPEELFHAIATASPQAGLFEQNLNRIQEHLTRTHGFALSDGDRGTIQYVYKAFTTAGPEIRYSFPSPWNWRRFPSYEELMLETDMEGHNRSYIANEVNFQILKKLHRENRIVPIVGDFAGERAIDRVGRYVREHGATVSAFYTSNVEFYLFQTDDWRKFFSNVAGLPLDGDSTFIRAYFNNTAYRFSSQRPGVRSLSFLGGMKDLITDFEAGKIRSYDDVINRSDRSN